MLPLRKNKSQRGDGASTGAAGGPAANDETLPRILQLPAEIDPLNRLTVGHVVLGFLAFRAHFVIDDAKRIRGRMLDRYAFAELEAAQHRMDLGTIDREQFAQFVERLIGDQVNNVAFAGLGFWGSAVNCAPRHRFSRMLQMTTAQRRRARIIHRELHEAIGAARAQAHVDIRAELNSRQAAMLDDPRSALRANPETGRKRPFSEEMIAACALQPDQQASVAVLCALLRTSTRVLHERARQRFIRALSPPQRRLLELIENVPPLENRSE